MTKTYSDCSQKWCFTSRACHRNRNLNRQTVQNIFNSTNQREKICVIILICGSQATEYAHIDSWTFFPARIGDIAFNGWVSSFRKYGARNPRQTSKSSPKSTVNTKSSTSLFGLSIQPYELEEHLQLSRTVCEIFQFVWFKFNAKDPMQKIDGKRIQFIENMLKYGIVYVSLCECASDCGINCSRYSITFSKLEPIPATIIILERMPANTSTSNRTHVHTYMYTSDDSNARHRLRM